MGKGPFWERGKNGMTDRVNENGREKESRPRKLTIEKGQELELHASEGIWDSEEFMYAAYEQALRALEEIVRHTKRFEKRREEDRDGLEMELFQYSGNVIAFVGQRGAGKTQTMLSFSRSLANPGDKFDNGSSWQELRGCRFFVMPPISPSALEKSTEFLRVVLSRFYRYITGILEKDDACMREDPGLRTELWRQFNLCVSGINGLTEESKAADISELQDTVDGLTLRESFYRLVSLTVNRVLQKKGDGNVFLVLQVDDADSQVENGYRVLEDIRRYLLIPNLVILMSSDIEMFHNVVMQNHLKQFPDLVTAGVLSLNSLSRTCRKYIDKLIPPSHMVHLPRLEQYTDLGGAGIELEYILKRKGKQDEAALAWTQGLPSRKLQDIVLGMIFKKTGIIFVNQDPWLNYIIPRSLRGLNQFLYLLTEMEDIPELGLTSWTFPLDVARAVLKQYAVANRNLELFRNYFFYDWIDVKIENQKDRLFLRRLVSTPRVNFVPETLEYFQKRFAEQRQEFSDIPATLYGLDKLVFRWKRDHRLTQEEDLLSFVIGTIRTIRGHMAAWKVKRDTAEEWLLPDGEGKNKLFACDYDPERWQITADFPVLGNRDDFYRDSLKIAETVQRHPLYPMTTGEFAQAVIDSWKEGIKPADDENSRKINELCSRVFFTPDSRSDDPEISLLQFIALFLRMTDLVTEPVEEEAAKDRSPAQRFVYWAQENALRAALNWDVTEKICLEMSNAISKKDFGFKENSFVENLGIFFRSVDEIFAELNHGTLERLLERDSDKAYGFANLIQDLFSDNFKLGKLSDYMRQERYIFHTMDSGKREEGTDTEPVPSGDGETKRVDLGEINNTLTFTAQPLPPEAIILKKTHSDAEPAQPDDELTPDPEASNKPGKKE